MAEARRLYQKSLLIREQAYGKGRAANAESLIGLANCYRKEGHIRQAQDTFEQALALCRTPDGKYNPPVTDVLESYAELLRATNREAKAVEMESLARSIKGSQ